MTKRHYYLLATQILYSKGNIERTRNFNVLVPSDNEYLNRFQLGRAQQQAQVRFFTEFDATRESTIIDVFIMSVSYIGAMTNGEFHEGFDLPDEAPQETSQETPVESTEEPQDPTGGTE